MDVVITFRSGTKFAWKNVKASEVEAVAVDIKELAEKDQEAIKTARLFKKEAELNGKKGEKMGIAEDYNLEADLRAGARVKPKAS
jgi:hypothetical protein